MNAYDEGFETGKTYEAFEPNEDDDDTLRMVAFEQALEYTSDVIERERFIEGFIEGVRRLR